ncbi:MAG: exodeoxyribonuclease VII small subunit [SAR202 cluster bacterium Io17-Chloro-G6]|nr:MAG: exodeoxyribonuclease VII small subunit [SAR202 cluster bacterium Io17-Chloro-G6]
MAKPKRSSPNGNTESTNFEGSFARLHEMAEQLEAGGLTLAEATARFEEGMKLVQHCNELLNTAELKITELREAYRPDESQPGFDGLDELGEDPEE